MILTCPYCRNAKSVADVYDWFDTHVGHCRRQVGERRQEQQRPAALRLLGTVLAVLRTANGAIRDVRVGSNLVVDTGLELATDLLQGSGAVADWQAVGTGTASPAAGNTALQTEIGTRVNGTLSQVTTKTDRLVSTFVAGNATGALTETGRLTASSGGILFARHTFSAINKDASDSLEVTHDIVVS